MSKFNQQLPPQIPQSRDKIERAICLLGSRVKGELTSKPQQELSDLVGRYPNPLEATAWKQSLKQLLKQKQKQK
jgi:hypothetical protein